MRLILSFLVLAVLVLGVWTFQIAPEHGWWFPQDVSVFGHEIDHLFDVILVLVGATFVLTEAGLVWCIFAYGRKRSDKAYFTHGNHRLEQVWTAIPAVILLWLAFAQMETWAEIKFDKNFPHETYSIEKPIARVYASQFDWRVRYPDESGNFDGANVVESPFDFYVPVNTPIVFHLISRDVLHSFFLPNMRLKQDAVPGMIIPVWFQATEVGAYDLVCAELCGWGHYKMAGKVHVVTQEDYDAWLAARRADLHSNGMEDVE